MSWLYEHRDQLDGLKPLVEIAHWAVISHVPPDDQDDVEQDIVLKLLKEVERHGNKGKAYLWAAARYEIYDYYSRKDKDKGLRYLNESENGVKAAGTWLCIPHVDIDARLDARDTLTTLPERLIKIGHKILNGERLNCADQAYRIRQIKKLRPKSNGRRPAYELSALEKRMILKLYYKDVCVNRIALAMGRSTHAVKKVLAAHRLPSRRTALIRERNERIRHAYFIDGNGISQIRRELGYSNETIYKAIRSAGAF